MKRFLKLGLAAVLAITTIASVFAFTTKEPKEAAEKKLATVNFEYIGPRPADVTDVTTPANWQLVETLTPSSPFEVIYGISFDDITYPLNSLDQPDFPNQSDLTDAVADHFLDPLNHAQTFDGVTIYFTEE